MKTYHLLKQFQDIHCLKSKWRLYRSRTHTSTTKSGSKNEMSSKTLDLAYAITNTKNNNDDLPHIINQRRALSKAITLIESRAHDDIRQGDLLLNYLIEVRNRDSIACSCNEQKDEKSSRFNEVSFRIGIAGAPGAGKSSFIEKFGIYLLDELSTGVTDKEQCDDYDLYRPKKLAALCIDPSSTLSGGSILGDKTRMTELSRHSKAFVRPSPSRCDLGGVSSHTNDVITLCQAAGFDLVLVETVGIGQSEVSASQVVDMLILIVPPGGGDGLQGVKKGIMEVADLVIVNKADGDFFNTASLTAAEYKGATHFLKSRVDGWDATPVLLASARTKFGFDDIWATICKFRTLISQNGELEKRKIQQSRYWMWKHIQNLISSRVKDDQQIGIKAESIQRALDSGKISPRCAASEILRFLDLTIYPKKEE